MVPGGAASFLVEISVAFVIGYIDVLFDSDAILLIEVIVSQEHVVDSVLHEPRLLSVFESSETLVIFPVTFANITHLQHDLGVQINETALHDALDRLILRLLVEVTRHNNRHLLKILRKILVNLEALSHSLLLKFGFSF